MYAKAALVAREQKLCFAMGVNRQFENDAKWGDTINVRARSHLTAQTKDRDANAATIYETITETKTQITLGTWEYSAIAIETATKRQVDRDMVEFYAPEQGYALALSVDDVLAGLVDDITNNVGTLAVENSYDEVLRAWQYLEDANAPEEDRWFAVSPAAVTGFMKLEQYINGDYKVLQGERSSKSARDKAFIGAWMGIPIYKSTNVEGTNAAGHDNGLLQKEALALVMQMKATFHQMFDVDYFALKVAVEHLYGTKEMREDHACWIKGA